MNELLLIGWFICGIAGVVLLDSTCGESGRKPSITWIAVAGPVLLLLAVAAVCHEAINRNNPSKEQDQ